MLKRSFFGLVLVLLLLQCKERRSDNAAEKMQEFVINISNYARSFDPDFIVIPQNGIELAFESLDTSEGKYQAYLDAIDGVGVEELFFNGDYDLDEERLAMLQQLRASEKIMVSEFVNAQEKRAEAYAKNYHQGFISFVRSADNYHYKQIPDTLPHENANDVLNLSQVQNYLYLISTDNFATKEDMINAVAATNVDLVLVDLFFESDAFTAEEISRLRMKANGAKRLVIAYMNIGSAEKFRYYWKKSWGLHHPLWLKRKYDGYADEFWVKFWRKDWQDIIYGNDASYMKKIIDAGFDGAYLDNVEAYYFLYHKE